MTGEPSMNQPFSLCEIPVVGSRSNGYLNGIGDRSKGIPIMDHLGHLGMDPIQRTMIECGYQCERIIDIKVNDNW